MDFVPPRSQDFDSIECDLNLWRDMVFRGRLRAYRLGLAFFPSFTLGGVVVKDEEVVSCEPPDDWSRLSFSFDACPWKLVLT